MDALFETLLAAPRPRGPDFTSFWTGTRELRERFGRSVHRAIALGFSADRLGFAFLGGYSAALTRVDPTLTVNDLAALCATEDGGGHPRAIRATLVNGRLTGDKRFVSGGPLATRLLVVASEGTSDDGRPRLRVVRVAPTSPGVTLVPMPELPFVPEVPHASVELRDVEVREGDVLPGDGYADVLKPFRTLEDLHVFAALLGYLWSVARRSAWPEATGERLWAGLTSAAALGDADPRAPGTHLALAGLLSETNALLSAASWSDVPAEEAARFARDRPLLKVASAARETRRVKAWQAVRGAAPEE